MQSNVLKAYGGGALLFSSLSLSLESVRLNSIVHLHQVFLLQGEREAFIYIKEMSLNLYTRTERASADPWSAGCSFFSKHFVAIPFLSSSSISYMTRLERLEKLPTVHRRVR